MPKKDTEDAPPTNTHKLALPQLLLILLLCLSVTMSVVYVQGNFRSLESFGMADRTLSKEETLKQRRAGFETGKEIVERAYRETYKHIVDNCQEEGAQSLMKCMQALHQNTSTTFPWWFETLLRDGSQYFLHGPWHVQILRSPTVMVEFCNIEKVASSEWKILKCRLDGKLAGSCYDPIKHVKPEEPKAIFLRDPLERFLSGFVDKCTTSEFREKETHCEPNEVFAPGTPEERGERMKEKKPPPLIEELTHHNTVLFDAYTDILPLKWNVHFYPSALYCNGLYRTLDSYDFVGFMDKDFHETLRAFAKRYNMETAVARVFRLKSTNSTNTFQPQSHRLKKNRTATASKRVKEYYTPKTLRKALQYMSIDYADEGLGLPLPDWVDEILAQNHHTV